MARTALNCLVIVVLCLGSTARATPKKLPPGALTPTVKAPGYKPLQRLGRGAGIRDALAHGKGAPLGGARFLAVLSSKKQQKVFVLVVDGAGGTWRVEHRLELGLTFSASTRRGGPCVDVKVAAVGFVGDFDADGKPEAKVRTLFCRVVPAIGNVMVRRLAMINLDDTPRIATHFELGYDALPTAMGAIKARERYRDLNNDGHPDLQVTQQEAVFKGDKISWKRSWRRFIYQPDTDSYEESRVLHERKRKRKRKRKRRRKRRRRR